MKNVKYEALNTMFLFYVEKVALLDSALPGTTGDTLNDFNEALNAKLEELGIPLDDFLDFLGGKMDGTGACDCPVQPDGVLRSYDGAGEPITR